jgi:hypothetical protein
MFAEARAKVSLDRPLKYENVEPHRLLEIKDEAYSRICDLRSRYFRVVGEDPRKEVLRDKFTKCLMNMQLLKAFKRWKFIKQMRLIEKIKAYQDQVKALFNKRAVESAERAAAAKCNLKQARQIKHDHIRHESKLVEACISRVEKEL